MRLFSLFFLFIFLPIFISAQQQNQTLPAKKVLTILDFKDELKLSSTQIDKIKEIIDNFEKNAKPLREKITMEDREIRELLDKEADLELIKAKVKEVFSLRADLIIMEIEAGRKIDGLLTSEQLNKWKEIKKKGGKK